MQYGWHHEQRPVAGSYFDIGNTGDTSFVESHVGMAEPKATLVVVPDARSAKNSDSVTYDDLAVGGCRPSGRTVHGCGWPLFMLAGFTILIRRRSSEPNRKDLA